MNTLCLVGRLVSDPEVKKTKTGKLCAKYTLAVYRTKETTDFIDCIVYEKGAELAEKYFHKGLTVAISGEMRVDKYEDKEGNKRSYAYAFVHNQDFCTTKAESESRGDEPPFGCM